MRNVSDIYTRRDFAILIDADYVPVMIVGKLIAGVLALFVANYIYERQKKNI